MCRCYQNLPEDIDTIIWTGDVQTLRSEADLDSLACPPKYRRLGDFRKYWQEELSAPALTIFIGGNHESSAHLAQLPFGGWVAPNMFYLGYSGVIHIKENQSEIRLAGLSGIYNQRSYRQGHFETEPFDQSSVRSVYHVRELDIARLSCVSQVTAMITHDWPSDLFTLVGEPEAAKDMLLRKKPYFKNDIANGVLGNPMSSQLLTNLKPMLWCAAHLHINYHCVIKPRSDNILSDDKKCTSRKCLFLTHDKPKSSVATSIWDSDSGVIQTPISKQPIELLETESSERSQPKETGNDQPGKTVEGSGTESPPAKRSRGAPRDTKIFIDLEWLTILRRTYISDQYTRRNVTPIDRAQAIQQVSEGEMAKLRESIEAADLIWPEDVSLEYPCELAELSSIKFAFPIMDHKDPEAQTKWWLSLIAPGSDNSASEKRSNISSSLSVQRIVPPVVSEGNGGPRDVSPPARYRKLDR